MKIATIVLLAVAALLCLPGYAAAQAESEAADLPPGELKTKFEQARNRKDWKNAVIYIKELVNRNPDKALYRYDYADTLLLKGSLQEADTEYEKALELKPTFIEAHIGRARICARQKNEKAATGYMLEAARKGYPVREMAKLSELRRYLRGDVKFFLKMLEFDIPRIERIRDPFINPLQKAGEAPGPKPGPEDDNGDEPVPGDPPGVQRNKSLKMKDLLFQIQRQLNENKEEEARANWKFFVELYHDVERGKITEPKYREQMIETWKVAQDSVYPRLRKIELRKFKEEARAALDKLQEDYDKKNIEAAVQHNDEIVQILEPKLKSGEQEFRTLAKGFDLERERLFERIKILQEFQKNVRPFLKITAILTGPAPPKNKNEREPRMKPDRRPDKSPGRKLKSIVRIAIIETVFGGELKKIGLRESDKLPDMKEFKIVEIEEEKIWARYKGERVKIELGTGFGSKPKLKP
jgi:tetratricopeptide (TPR) repeat protein